MIPDRSECLRLMRERQMLEHIIEHSLRVAQVAGLLAGGLSRAGEAVDLRLVEAASLLHDLAKIESLTTRADHALAGQRIVSGMGFAPCLGEVIRHHVRLPEDDEPALVCRLECEVVNYSDKRCNGSLIVSLTERFDYIRGRYGRTPDIIERINELEEHTRGLERRLFARLPFGPEQIARRLEGRPLEKTA